MAIAKLRSRDLNPIASEGGVWFNLEVVKQPQVMHTAHVVNESIPVNGEQYERVKPAPLSQEVLDRMPTESFDLGNLFTVLTVEQVKLIVDSNYDPEVVDRVFASPVKNEDSGVGPVAVDANVAVAAAMNGQAPKEVAHVGMSVSEFKAKYGR